VKKDLYMKMNFFLSFCFRAPNGPGWADENLPIGYQALAQPTYGFSSKIGPAQFTHGPLTN
jgi:hypothetical protein